MVGSYISDRYQCVSVGGILSELIAVTSGVMQGSLLGSVLFSIVINDIFDPHIVDYHNGIFDCKMRDLGVLLETKMKLSYHIEVVIFKSSKKLSFMKRVLREFSDPYTFCLSNQISSTLRVFSCPIYSARVE
jgi:hypothetical protein